VKLVVDTNIVFSSLLNSSKGVGKLFLTSKKHFELYTCEFLRIELHNNRTKLIKLSKVSESELDELIDFMLQNITIIHEDIIPLSLRQQANDLASGVDESDSPFLALSLYLKCRLWTGDRILTKGLRRKKCTVPILTSEIQALL
jgi:predicted nucleic acid-binding protein